MLSWRGFVGPPEGDRSPIKCRLSLVWRNHSKNPSHGPRWGQIQMASRIRLTMATYPVISGDNRPPHKSGGCLSDS